MRCTRIFFSVILLLAFAGCSTQKEREQPSPRSSIVALPAQPVADVARPAAPTNGDSASAVRASMQNVDYHLTDQIVLNIASLNGRLIPKPGKIPVFDDKDSFGLEVETAKITLSPTALTNDLNDYVFAKPDAPLKKLSASVEGDLLVIKGQLANKAGLAFETAGTISVTPDGMIRVHTTKVTALHLPLKGLMDLVGLDTQKLIKAEKVTGVTVDKDDLILDPEHILPPPQLHGHLTSIKVENGAIDLAFGPETGKAATPAISEACGARNYVHFKGGSVRFGKLTMNDSDLELMDVSPADSFDFAIDHYNDQLVAGYSKMTRSGVLCVHMPDYNKLNQPEAANPNK